MSDRRSVTTRRFTAFDAIQAAPSVSNTELVRLMRGVRSVAQLQTTLEQVLPPDVRPHVRGCLSQGTELVRHRPNGRFAYGN